MNPYFAEIRGSSNLVATHTYLYDKMFLQMCRVQGQVLVWALVQVRLWVRPVLRLVLVRAAVVVAVVVAAVAAAEVLLRDMRNSRFP
jgi:hypothetical protein